MLDDRAHYRVFDLSVIEIVRILSPAWKCRSGCFWLGTGEILSEVLSLRMEVSQLSRWCAITRSMERKDSLDEAWRELEVTFAPYEQRLTPEQKKLLTAAQESGHPALKELRSFVDCEEATFYDVNQRLQKSWKDMLGVCPQADDDRSHIDILAGG